VVRLSSTVDGFENKPVKVIDPVTCKEPVISAEPVKFKNEPEGP
jgi:hypothetical protein